MTSSVLFQSFGLHLGGLFFLTIIVIMFRQRNQETKKTITGKIFRYLILSTYALNICQISAFVFKYLEEIKGLTWAGPVAIICARGFIITSMLFDAFFEQYFLKKMVYTDDNPKRDKAIYITTIVIALVLFAITFFGFEIKFHNESGLDKFVLNGNFSIFTYTEFALAVLTLLFCFIKKRKELNFIKTLILFYVMFGYLMISFLEKISKYNISDVPYILSLYIVTIYFTLENTNYLQANMLKSEEARLISNQKYISDTVNKKSKDVIDDLNEEYITTNLILNSRFSKEEINSKIDTMISNNEEIIKQLTDTEEGKV